MPTLLIADDYPSVLHTLEFVLASEELRVVLASSAASALALLPQGNVDAALIDLHMPVADGLALTRALKTHAAQSARPLPVWIMTAAPSLAAAEQARQAGAESLLKKPFDGPAFREELLRHLSVQREPSHFAA